MLKMSRNMNLGDFLNIFLSNSKHLGILNFLVFAILCKKQSCNYKFCFQHEYLGGKGLYIYCMLIRFFIHSSF